MRGRAVRWCGSGIALGLSGLQPLLSVAADTRQPPSAVTAHGIHFFGGRAEDRRNESLAPDVPGGLLHGGDSGRLDLATHGSRLMRRSSRQRDPEQEMQEDAGKLHAHAAAASERLPTSLVEVSAGAASASASEAATGIYRPGVRLVAGRVPWLTSRRCLSTDGALIFVEECYKGHIHRVPERQKWQWQGKQLKNNEFNLCLTEPWHDGKTHGNVELSLEKCDAKATQNWMFDSFGRLKNQFEGYKCIDLVEENTMIYMNTCNGGESQWFSYY
eukprot:TRINITY_DN103206_c0_g1_i1.p1 TRINITY_DN103206_c0_g1~~TRINITY_DN103206_c0_g1_i1.p1  ORF type:complete len:273 (-),score=72.43 TRINITY_DN103206_c0_g1_i1:42-860(-)